ncbi:MAG: hypothetical protein HQRvContig01_62 [Haloquadratum phage sp.]|nr:MAG: hypothetical protein HQRvContig01_62 [Haloquadratum phage sp.]
MQPNELIQALRQADQEQKQEIKQLLSSQTRKTTRRGLMTAGAGVLSWLAVGQAAGKSDLPRSSCEWFGNVDASGYNLQNLNALEGTGLTGGDRLTNIAGTNLTIDADGNLNASGGSSAGALTDSGTDTDGGDGYVLPNAADNIDLQGDGAIQNADTISGTSATLQSLSTGNAVVNSAPTLYVRSAGDDANTGLDSSNPKATIQSALDNAALAGYDDWIVVDIRENGATFNEALTIDKYHPPVKILGPTDGSDNPDVTIDAGGTAENWLDMFGANLFLENVKIGSAPFEARIIENSTVDFKNCAGPSSLGDANFIAGSSNSYVQIWPSTEFDISGLGSDRCLALAGGFALIQGTLRGGTQWVFSAEENSGFIILNGAVIDAATDGGVPVHSRESSFGKTSADHQNAAVGVEAANFGGVDITPDAGFTGTTDRKQIDGTGYINDAADPSPTFQTNDGDIPGIPSSSQSVSPGFDSWRQPSVSRPTQLVLSVVAETDGTGLGRVRLSVDESGGTSADYNIPIADIDPDNAAGTQQRGGLSVIIPRGSQYQIENTADPNDANQIFASREYTL